MSRRVRFENAALAVLDKVVIGWEVVNGYGVVLMRHAAPAVGAQLARTARHPLLWWTVYVSAWCGFSYLFIDRPLALLLKARVGGEVEGFFKIVTRLGEAGLYLYPAALLALGLLFAAWKAPTAERKARLRAWAVRPAFLFIAIALSGLISNLLKFSIGRFRPRHLFESGMYGVSPFNSQWSMNSFPSGHSQAAFAAMLSLAFIFPRYDGAFLALAALVALSRVVTTVHFLSDAVAGSFLAIAVTIMLKRWADRKGITVALRFERDRVLGE